MITPIVIHSSGNNKPDNKCPKCGHEWNNKREPMSKQAKIIVTLIIFIGLYLIIAAFDIFNGGVMYNAIFVRSVENYEVPVEYEILVNNKDRYIIKKGQYYLTRANDTKLTFEKYTGIYPPLKCISEKRAKSTLKYYLDKKELNTFKNKTE